jgi:hypothetical protein
VKPIPQGEEEVYGTTAGGKLYVLGGLGVFPGWEPKRMLWSFDPATSEWTRLQNLPEGIHHPGFAAIGGKLYSLGGFTIARPATGLPAWVPSKSVWIYDIAAQSWSKGPELPTARGALTATADGTRVYAIGGAKNPDYSTPELRPNVPVENVAIKKYVQAFVVAFATSINLPFPPAVSWADQDAATRPASTTVACPRHCAPRWQLPSSARLARPAACRA